VLLQFTGIPPADKATAAGGFPQLGFLLLFVYQEQDYQVHNGDYSQQDIG
jgi:hypothetical protein